MHVFKAIDFEGAPREGEEMRPQWYKTEDIPYGEMWIDDIHWLPIVLKGHKIKAKFTFDKTGDAILGKEVVVV